MLGSWWCCGGDEKAARCEFTRAMATAELRELGGCCGSARTCEGGGGNAKMEAWLSAGGCGGVEGAPRRVVACADRPAATRGRFPRHVACEACRCRPLNGFVQSIQRIKAEPDDAF